MQSADFANMRRAMVDSQLRTSGVTDAWVLAAMGSTKREDFVPESARATAYMDRSIALADGKILNPPVATALMLQAAEVTVDDKILFVGEAKGYAATLLATRASVTAIQNAATPTSGSFSLIFIDGAVEELPEALIAAAQENARFVTGLVERGVTSLALGILRCGRKINELGINRTNLKTGAAHPLHPDRLGVEFTRQIFQNEGGLPGQEMGFRHPRDLRPRGINRDRIHMR